MYLDLENLFSDDQDISQVAATYPSTNALDLTASPRAIGPGATVKCMAQMTAALVGATATMNVRLICSAVTALTTPTVIKETSALVVGTFIAGWTVIFSAPVEAIPLRFLGFDYVIATATTTAGTITAGILWDTQTSDSDWVAETGR